MTTQAERESAAPMPSQSGTLVIWFGHHGEILGPGWVQLGLGKTSSSCW